MINEEILYGKIYPWLTANGNFKSQLSIMKDHLTRQKTTWEAISQDIEDLEDQDNEKLDDVLLKCHVCSHLLNGALESVEKLEDAMRELCNCYSEVYYTFKNRKE